MNVPIGKILFIHAVCLLALLAAMLIFSDHPVNALWAGVGGLIGLLGVLTQGAFFKLFALNQVNVTKLLLWAESCKIVAIVALFSLLFVFVPEVKAFWVFVGFGMTIVSSLVALLF